MKVGSWIARSALCAGISVSQPVTAQGIDAGPQLELSSEPDSLLSSLDDPSPFELDALDEDDDVVGSVPPLDPLVSSPPASIRGSPQPTTTETKRSACNPPSGWSRRISIP